MSDQTAMDRNSIGVYALAELLDVCPATVRREAKRGRLRGTKVGSVWRFTPDAIRAYLAGAQ